MGLFGGQFSSVVEWKEYSDDIIFWKFPSSEIKKGSRLIIRPGQDAIFMYNGRIEGIFREDLFTFFNFLLFKLFFSIHFIIYYHLSF